MITFGQTGWTGWIDDEDGWRGEGRNATNATLPRRLPSNVLSVGGALGAAAPVPRRSRGRAHANAHANARAPQTPRHARKHAPWTRQPLAALGSALRRYAALAVRAANPKAAHARRG